MPKSKLDKILAEVSDKDEPIFLMRAKDKLSRATIKFYIALAKQNNCDPAFIEELKVIKKEFTAWRRANKTKVKMPD